MNSAGENELDNAICKTTNVCALYPFLSETKPPILMTLHVVLELSKCGLWIISENSIHKQENAGLWQYILRVLSES